MRVVATQTILLFLPNDRFELDDDAFGDEQTHFRNLGVDD